jgi:hypothetical protein
MSATAYFADMRQTVALAAERGGYTRRMFKADRDSMRAWARAWRLLRIYRPGDREWDEARESLRMARYFRDKSIEGSRPRKPSPRQLALL